MSRETKTYQKRSIIKTTIEQMIAFHQDRKALNKLTPPPIFVRLNRDGQHSLTEGELEFTLWFGPIPVHWTAQHSPGPNEYSFVDKMVSGPMAYWHHEHIMEPIPEGVGLTDRITYAHHPGYRGWLTRLMFDGLPLRIRFSYRHFRTRMETT